MQKGRNSYTLQLDCESSFAEKIIRDFIKYNNFHFTGDDREKTYKVGGYYSGVKCFSYYLSGHILVFHAWIEKKGVEYSVEQDRYNSFFELYKDSLNELFQSIVEANNYVENVHHVSGNSNHGTYNTVKNATSDHGVSNPQKFVTENKSLNEEMTKRNNNALNGFTCGMFSIFLSAFIPIGPILSIVGIVKSISGINSEKYNYAILGLCLSFIGLFISLITFI